MMTIVGIVILLLILLVGYIKLRKEFSGLEEAIEFASEYRKCFNELVTSYFDSYDRYERRGSFSGEMYEWLTKNVERIQRRLGQLGIIDYTAPFNKFRAPRYEVIINTIPKFRDGTITEYDANWVDDCLLRYVGSKEELLKESGMELRNPFIWFRTGIQNILTIPLYVLNWFGIINKGVLYRVTGNVFFKVLGGVAAIIAFAANLVTIFGSWSNLITFLQKHIR